MQFRPFHVKLDLKNEVGSYCWSICIMFPFISFFALPTEAPGYCLCSCHYDGATFQRWGGASTSQKVFCFERRLFNRTHPGQQQQQITFRYCQLRLVKCCHRHALLMAAELWGRSHGLKTCTLGQMETLEVRQLNSI